MRLKPIIIAATLFTSAAAQTELPTPPQATAGQNSYAYLFHAGAGDVFEISASMMAIQHSQKPGVRAFATMPIADYTDLSNTTLTTAKSASAMPPPPVLSTAQMGMITQLTNAGAAFDRVYLQQQVSAH